ncbi:hypothetical protein GCM10009547_38890 [Sporichthya brevicatena]|uniref:Uncharacterized protein n=1 Tax=Sporichthya brevicatena TaxID=171442 RepID=A0ABP3SBA1_9ACTN
MSQIIETSVPENPTVATDAEVREAELLREEGRMRAHDGAVESTYWYMVAMFVLGLYAAFWIVLFTRMNP